MWHEKEILDIIYISHLKPNFFSVGLKLQVSIYMRTLKKIEENNAYCLLVQSMEIKHRNTRKEKH